MIEAEMHYWEESPDDIELPDDLDYRSCPACGCDSCVVYKNKFSLGQGNAAKCLFCGEFYVIWRKG